MDQKEIYEMVIREMTETALSERRENCSECEQALYSTVSELSAQAQDVMDHLPKEEQQVLEDYFDKTNMIADHECAYLYVQGAKDCVMLLKKLGAFNLS